MTDTPPRDLNLATFAGTPRALRHLRPTSVAEVQSRLADAARAGRRVQPISAGRNWGYGSATPRADADVLDLGAMDAILEYDRALGVVVIEPGVTQGRLYDFLVAEGGSHWLDPAGAARSVSIVGNTLERGFGHTAYADHWANVLWMEVVLADGQVVRSGFAGHRGAAAANAFRWGAGPIVDGLFSQANLGVVTKMALALMPRPERFETVFFAAKADAGLEGLIDGLRHLRQGQFIRSAAHVVNDLKVFQSLDRYPWERMGGVTPLSEEVRLELRRRWGVAEWNGIAGLYGTRRQVAEARRQVRRTYGPLCSRLAFVSQRKLGLAKALARVGIGAFARLIDRVEPAMALVSGQPTDGVMDSVYWRKRGEVPADADPDRDRCGLLWIPPVAPLKGAAAREMANLVTAAFERHGFEPAMSMTAITERALDNIVCLAFDRDVPGEDARALACYADASQALAARGYFPYRTHATGFDHRAWAPQTTELQDRLRAALDPQGVFATRDRANP